MKCPKCGGRMSFEQFTAGGVDVAPWSYEGWRCVYCGEVVDSLILNNRAKSKSLKEENEGTPAGSRRGVGSH